MNTTEIKESKYARSLIEASLDPLVTINTDGKITDMNKATVNITGVEREKLIDSDFFEYFTEIQKAREVYQKVFANGSVADSPLTLRHKNGELTDVLFNGSVYKDANGNVLGVVIVARDVTEQKRIAKELTNAKIFAEMATEKAEEAQRRAENATQLAQDAVNAKQQFLSNMSHEIRTPMNAIIGFTKVLLKTELSAKQREYLTAIKSSGDALIVLINDILDLAKVDAGKMTFEQIPFRMSTSLSAMLYLFEPKIQEKNLQLVKVYDKKIPEVLIGDPVRLNQIILNLMSNAVKFTKKGKITVSAYLQHEDEENVTIEIAVSDTGVGIEADKINTIFGNFQQATNGTSRLHGGTGLGLAISKQLVEAQHGNISVKSAINEGTTFSFILTFKKSNAALESEPESFDNDNEFENSKILVVEDMVLNQLLMKTLLEDFNFQCDIASNGKIAIEKLQSNSYDLILMDLQMPVMNGFEATEFIRNTMRSDIPIIALTADVTTVDLKKCKAVGMNDYLAKPINDRLLYNKMVAFLRRHSSDKINYETVVDGVENVKEGFTSLNYLTRITKSDPRLMTEMISLYLEQTKTLISQMKLSVENKDWDQLKTIAHKMIPSFLIVGIEDEFKDIAIKIQEYTTMQEHSDKIPELVLQLKKVLSQSCEELEEELNLINHKVK